MARSFAPVVNLAATVLSQLEAELAAAVRAVERGQYDAAVQHTGAALPIARRGIISFEARELAIRIAERVLAVHIRDVPLSGHEIRELKALCRALRTLARGDQSS